MKKVFISICCLCVSFIALAQDSLQKSKLCLSSSEELKILSTLWQQNAAEYRALCYQAFNAATDQLNKIPKRKFRKEKIAIITDLDETILDNSYNEADMIKKNTTWNPALWKQWTDLSAATAVPGAVEFLQYAKQKGVSIFYVSNRSVVEIGSTLINLKKLNLPDADTSHMLFMLNEASKETRRQALMKNYNVVMLMGDNLNDFTNAFEGKNIQERFLETDKAKTEWGKKFIVLPNTTYGEWENALYNYQHGLNDEQKLKQLLLLLKTPDAIQ